MQQEFTGQPQTSIVQRKLTIDDDVVMHHDDALPEVILKFKLTMILPEMNVDVTVTFIILPNKARLSLYNLSTNQAAIRHRDRRISAGFFTLLKGWSIYF